MGVKKVSASSRMPEVKKKSILQQVMKPKDWIAIGVLVVVSAFCWLWVLNAYQQTISVDNFVSGKVTNRAIDRNGIL